MHKDTEDALDLIDASIFSGDVLHTDLDKIKEYLGRWTRAVEEHEKLEAEESDPLDGGLTRREWAEARTAEDEMIRKAEEHAPQDIDDVRPADRRF